MLFVLAVPGERAAMRFCIVLTALCGWAVCFSPPVVAHSLIIGGKFQQPIPAEGTGPGVMDPLTLDVDQHFLIRDLNVRLHITHTSITDLQILLGSPQGNTVMLAGDWQQPWKQTWPDLDALIDDQAKDPLSACRPPFVGSFKPAPGQSLADFNGLNAHGPWTLRIEDRYPADNGTLKRWQLHFTYYSPEPSSLTFFLFTLLALRSRRCPHRAFA